VTATIDGGPLARGIRRLNDTIGRSIAWLTLLMAVATFAVVVLRYGFNLGYAWLQEAVLWMHALTFMLGAAYTLAADEHVRVDVFYRNATPRRQAWVNLLGVLLFLLPFCGYVIYESWDYVAASWRILERSREASGLPGLYLLKTAIPVTAVLLALQGLAIVLESLARLRGRSA